MAEISCREFKTEEVLRGILSEIRVLGTEGFGGGGKRERRCWVRDEKMRESQNL